MNRRQKAQIKYFVFGAAFSIIFAGTTNILLPFCFGYYDLQVFGPCGLFFFFGFTSYAIIRHQLLDIKIVIQRGVIYSFLLALIVGTYIVAVTVIGGIFQRVIDIAPHIAAILITIAGIYGAPRIEKYFRRKTDRIFFKDKYDYSEAIDELSEAINKNINLEKLLADVRKRLKDLLKTKKISIILPEQNFIFDGREKLTKNGESPPAGLMKIVRHRDFFPLFFSEIPFALEQTGREKKFAGYAEDLKQTVDYGRRHGIAIAVPILLEKRLIGIILLGEKLSGDLYLPEDIRLLKTFSFQAAVAIEKAQLYEKIKAHSRELETMVEQRTAKISRLQEEQKQMMLEIAHGLQTPLTIIKGELGVLKRLGSGEKVAALEKTIDRTSKFIYDMLRLAKLESGDSRGTGKKINLSELLRELVEDVEVITGEAHIIIKHNIASGIFVSGERSELSELVMNLVSNSIKYIGRGPEKTISINLIRNRRGKAELSIIDTGVGIDKRHLPYLFSYFYRIEKKRYSEQGGTGLGLAISKRIVERHGGTIRVESEVGRGTKFVIELPCRRS